MADRSEFVEKIRAGTNLRGSFQLTCQVVAGGCPIRGRRPLSKNIQSRAGASPIEKLIDKLDRSKAFKYQGIN